MVEQYGAIGSSGLIKSTGGNLGTGSVARVEEGQDFKSLLMKSIEEVNRLQSEADQGINNLALGKSENVAEVFTAVKKAELAFQTLQQIQRKLLDAYDEIKQIRV